MSVAIDVDEAPATAWQGHGSHSGRLGFESCPLLVNSNR